jgi:hypothetical protein
LKGKYCGHQTPIYFLTVVLEKIRERLSILIWLL